MKAHTAPLKSRFHLSLLSYPDDRSLAATCVLIYGKEEKNLLSAMTSTPYVVGRTFSHEESLVIHEELKRISVGHSLTSSDAEIATLTFSPFTKKEAPPPPAPSSQPRTLWTIAVFAVALVAAYGLLKGFSRVSGPVQQEIPSAAASPFDARITKVEERVDFRRAKNFSWERAQADLGLYGGDAIRTFQNSSATLRYSEGSLLVVRPETLIVIGNEASKNKTTLEDGQIRARLSASSRQQSLTIETPEGIVELKGSATEEARMDTQRKNGKLEVAVISGQGAFAPRTDPTQAVALHQLQKIEVNGGEVSKPTSFLPAIQIIAPPDQAKVIAETNESYRFAWEDLGEGAAYQFQLLRDLPSSEIDRDSVLFEQEITSPTVTLNYLDPGLLYWRITATHGGVQYRSEIRKLYVEKP